MNDQSDIRVARHFQVFIEDQVAQRKYNDASEVIEDGLRLLEAREAKRDALHRALVEGERSGEAMPFDMDDWLDDQESRDSA